MNNSYLAAANANCIPFAVENLNTDSKVSGSNSASDSLSSPQEKSVAEERSTESIKSGPPISIHSLSADKMCPANPSDAIQDDRIETETIVSESTHPVSTSSASSFDDSMFLRILYFRGLDHAKSIAGQRGWTLSKSPESLLEDEVWRHAEEYRERLIRGYAVLSDEAKTTIKAEVFRGRK